MKGKRADRVGSFGRSAVFSQTMWRQKGLPAERKKEISGGGEEGTLSWALQGWGLAEEPGKPGPLWCQCLWTASCRELDPCDVLVNLRFLQNTLTPSPFCPQIWMMSRSRSPRLQKGPLLDPQKCSPRSEATSRRRNRSRMKCSNLVSITLPSPAAAAPGLLLVGVSYGESEPALGRC